MSELTTETTDLDGRLSVEYRNARLRMTAVARQLDGERAMTIVPACPQWTASDLLAHVTGLASDLGGGRPPRGDVDEWVDAQVAERRGRSPSAIVDEWESAAPAFEAMIADKPHRWWGLVYDVLVHELDLYGAVDSQPAAIDDDGLDVALQLGLRLVAGDLTKHDLAGFQVVTIDGAERRTFMVGGGDPELTLEATSFEALRLLGSRRTDDELRAARFSGDLDRYLPGLVHMDLPTTSLGEHRSTR
jgi:uncharacterized protein (TIGR03083 family)